jgi:hypothetical protein
LKKEEIAVLQEKDSTDDLVRCASPPRAWVAVAPAASPPAATRVAAVPRCRRSDIRV